MKKPLPIGVDNFEKLITNNYYFIDKSLFIKELLDSKGEVNLFARPRRFGKTLNLSMLQYFFEDTGGNAKNDANKELFEDLKIMQEGSAYTMHMGKYPVISLTLKSAKQGNFTDALYQLREAVISEFVRHSYILEMKGMTETQKELYIQLRDAKTEMMVYKTALKFLSECLFKSTGKKVIIFIDEYDVPLENSYFRGFYNDMADFIRSLFESALKTNPYLEFAVITGCLRISKESVFTGLNHLNINTVLSGGYFEHFGFTQNEVDEITSYYGHDRRMDTIREWYDGYLFGKIQIYNPWSVIKFIYDLKTNESAYPMPYWINTSSNDIIRALVERAGSAEREQIEKLIAGECIEVAVHEEVTYEDMDACGEALWNFLYFTGYLTRAGERMDIDTNELMLTLVIPNVEVRLVYERTNRNWFKEELKKKNFQNLYKAMENGDAFMIQEIINEQLMQTISFFDSAENFYHGFLTGVLGQSKTYHVKSNRESGNGRGDIIVYSDNLEKQAYVLELKASAKFRKAAGMQKLL